MEPQASWIVHKSDNRHRFSRLEIIFLGIETLVVLAAALAFLRIVNDDVFITLRYAHNLVHGQGFVYTAGERVFGLTTVLLPLLEALFALPCLGNVLIGDYILQYSLLLGCVALAALYFRHAALLAALIPLIFFNAQTVGYMGNEIVLLLFFSLAALYCLRTGRDRLLALCLSLMYLARFDAILFGAIVSIWWFVKRRPRAAQVATHVAIWASLPVAWHAFSLFYYGAFLSNSVTSKLLASGDVKTFARVLWEQHLPDNVLGPWLPVGLLVLAGLIRSWRQTGVYIIWFCAFTVLYSVLQAPGITAWYFHTLTFAIIFGYAAGIALVARRMLVRNKTGVLLFAAAAACLLAASHLDYSWEANRYRLYKGVAEQLRTIAPPHAAIEMNEIGILGYYLTASPILDHHFLVTAQGSGARRFPSVEELRERVRPAWLALNPYREFTKDEIASYKGYSLEAVAKTPDQSIRLYLFRRKL